MPVAVESGQRGDRVGGGPVAESDSFGRIADGVCGLVEQQGVVVLGVSNAVGKAKLRIPGMGITVQADRRIKPTAVSLDDSQAPRRLGDAGLVADLRGPAAQVGESADGGVEVTLLGLQVAMLCSRLARCAGGSR